MNIRQHFFAGLLASILFGLIITSNVFADPVDIGLPGMTIRVTEKITNIACTTLSGTSSSDHGMKCTLTSVSGQTQTVYYTISYVNAGNTPSSQEQAIRNKLDGAGLLATGATGGNGTGGTGSGNTTPPPIVDPNSDCTSILPPSWCDPNSGDGIVEILSLILTIMTFGIGVLATIGLVISGIQWLTARDKEDQIVKAKSRIFNIVIGLAVWGIMWLLLSWLLPGGINLEITTT